MYPPLATRETSVSDGVVRTAVIACQTHRAVTAPSRTTAVDRDIIHRTHRRADSALHFPRSTRNPRGDIRNALKSGRNMWLFAHGILPGVTCLMPSARLSAMREAIASMPAEALSSLSAASSAESVSNPGRHTYVLGIVREKTPPTRHPRARIIAAQRRSVRPISSPHVATIWCTEQAPPSGVSDASLSINSSTTRGTPHACTGNTHTEASSGVGGSAAWALSISRRVMRHISMPRAFPRAMAAARELPCPEK